MALQVLEEQEERAGLIASLPSQDAEGIDGPPVGGPAARHTGDAPASAFHRQTLGDSRLPMQPSLFALRLFVIRNHVDFHVCIQKLAERQFLGASEPKLFKKLELSIQKYSFFVKNTFQRPLCKGSYFCLYSSTWLH